jgi:hypothetical protein
MRRRRKKKRNPDTGSMLAGVGGFVAVPIAANALGIVTESRPLAVVAHLGVAGLSAWGASGASSPATRYALVGGAMSSVLNAMIWGLAPPPVAPAMLHTTYQGQPAPAALPPPPPGVPSTQARQWLAFPPSAPAVPLVPGARYRAAIDLPFGAGMLATDDRVRSKAEEMGFSDVVIVNEPDWSDPFGKSGDADLFVEATYTGEPKWLERSERIVSAWGFS